MNYQNRRIVTSHVCPTFSHRPAWWSKKRATEMLSPLPQFSGLRLGAAQWRSQKACIELVSHLHRSSPILCKACASPGQLWRSMAWAPQQALRSECRNRCGLDLDLGLCLFTLHSSLFISLLYRQSRFDLRSLTLGILLLPRIGGGLAASTRRYVH